MADRLRRELVPHPPDRADLLGDHLGGLCPAALLKDDKGRTIAERGIDQVRTTERSKSFLRFAAIYGTCNVFFLLFYIIPTNAIAIHGDSWPRDTLKRSYFTDYLCGDGTNYACSSQGTPIPRPKSAHLSPAGELVPGEVPNSPRPPVEFSKK